MDTRAMEYTWHWVRRAFRTWALTASVAIKRCRSTWMLKGWPLTKRGVEEDAGGDDGTDAWEEAADSADTEVVHDVNEVEYYDESDGTTRDGKWHEKMCVDADNAKVRDDGNGAARVEVGRATENLDNDTKKFEKADSSETAKPDRPVLRSCKKPSPSERMLLTKAEGRTVYARKTMRPKTDQEAEPDTLALDQAEIEYQNSVAGDGITHQDNEGTDGTSGGTTVQAVNSPYRSSKEFSHKSGK
ncbi:hypothetical protein MRX96_047573 [Rhipicephalus microplus]